MQKAAADVPNGPAVCTQVQYGSQLGELVDPKTTRKYLSCKRCSPLDVRKQRTSAMGKWDEFSNKCNKEKSRPLDFDQKQHSVHRNIAPEASRPKPVFAYFSGGRRISGVGHKFDMRLSESHVSQCIS